MTTSSSLTRKCPDPQFLPRTLHSCCNWRAWCAIPRVLAHVKLEQTVARDYRELGQIRAAHGADIVIGNCRRQRPLAAPKVLSWPLWGLWGSALFWALSFPPLHPSAPQGSVRAAKSVVAARGLFLQRRADVPFEAVQRATRNSMALLPPRLLPPRRLSTSSSSKRSQTCIPHSDVNVRACSQRLQAYPRLTTLATADTSGPGQRPATDVALPPRKC